MMELFESEISCGVYQLRGILGVEPKKAEDYLASELHSLCVENGDKPPFVIFSNTDSKFADHLARKYRGSITKTKMAVNPSSGNKIGVYIFQVPKGFLKTHCTCCKDD